MASSKARSRPLRGGGEKTWRARRAMTRPGGRCALRLRVRGEDLRGVDGAGLRFESPAQCSAWWRALTRAKAAAAHERDVPDDYPGALAALGGTWYRALAATLVCGVDGSPLPGPAFAGPERPFMALAPARHPPRLQKVALLQAWPRACAAVALRCSARKPNPVSRGWPGPSCRAIAFLRCRPSCRS